MLPGRPMHCKLAPSVAWNSLGRKRLWCGIVDFETRCFLAHNFSCFPWRSLSSGNFALGSRVFHDPTLEPLDEAPTDSVLGV
jgi:hypothetical protein